jgi:hypothetical protein
MSVSSTDVHVPRVVLSTRHIFILGERVACTSIVVESSSYCFVGHFTGALVFVGHFTDGHFFFVGVAVGTLHVGMREGLGKTQVMLSYV